MDYLITYLLIGLAWAVVMWCTVPVDDPFWTPGVVLAILVLSVFTWPLMIAYSAVAAGLTWRRAKVKTQEPKHPVPELNPNPKWDNYIKAGK